MLIFLGNVLVIFPSFAQLKEIVKHQKKIKENLYASCTEVSNKEYASFISSLKNSNSKSELQLATIDSLQWRSKNSYNEPYVSYYHSHKAYEHYPVVNISYDAAVTYCNWLTKLYNEDEHRKFKKVKFRLPTVEEWEFAAKGNNSKFIYPWEGDKMQNEKGKMRANFKRGNGDANGVAAYLNENADITAPVNSYWPNSFGLYNMAGNVAEMTSTANSIKGGSWMDNAAQLKIAMNQSYDGNPKCYVGFRCFMEIIEK